MKALALCAAAAAVPLFAAPLIPEDSVQLYLEPEQSSTIRFTGESSTDTIPYTLRDYFDRKAGEGVLVRRNGRFETTLNLKQGFYELDFSGRRVGIVALPRRTTTADKFFGMESLLNTSPEKNIREGLTVLKRFGVSAIREYHNWAREETAPGKWRTEAEKIYPLAEKAGIEVTTFLSAAPEWSGGDLKRKGTMEYIPYPRKLELLEPSLLSMLERRKGPLGSFQVENEPDLKGIPGDSYLPLLAASSWIFRKNRIDLPLVLAAFSGWDASPELLAPYFKSGLLDYGDIFAFHTYKSPENLMEQMQTCRRLMEGPGRAMPIWITESGKPWSRGVRNPGTVYGGDPGKLRAAPEEDMTSALWIAMKAIEAKAGGAARYFPFTMRFFAEGVNNFGMTDFYWTPHRSMAAYLFCIQMLSGKEYIGDWKTLPPGIRIARVFSDGTQFLLVLYAPKTDELALTLPPGTFYAADGSVPAVENGRVRFAGGLLYVRLNAMPELKTDTAAMKMLKLSKSYKPLPRKAGKVVCQFAFWNEKKRDAVRYFSAPEKLEFHLFNLDDSPVEVEPELLLPEGGRVVSQSHSGKIRLEPETPQRIEFHLDMNHVKEQKRTILFRDRSGNGNPLCLQFLDVNAPNGVFRSWNMNRPSAWKANSSGKMTIGKAPEEEAIRFHTVWEKETDHWVYPEYILKPGESLTGLTAIIFEIRAKQKSGGKRFQHTGIQLSDKKNGYRMIPFPPPSEEWEQRVVQIPADWNLSGFDRIRIGTGPVDNELEYRLRSIRLSFREK